MASTLELLAPTGLTLTVELYPHGSDAIANTGGDSLTEATNRRGLYTATISETLSGWHTAHVKLSGTVIAAGDVLMADGQTCRVRDHDPKADVAFVSGTAQTAGDIVEILTAIKGAGWTTENLKAIKDAVDAIDPLDATETQAAAAAAIAAAGLAGTGGAYTQTVTVTSDGSTPIPNATVAIYSGSTLVDTKTTNSSGVATPTCDAGSYTLRVTASGYASSSTSITVTADAARTVSLAALSSVVGASDPSQTTAYWYVYGNDGVLVGAGDVTMTVEIIEVPGDLGYAYDDTPLSLSSNASGLISATLFKGAKYKVTLSDNREWTVRVPLNAGTTCKMSPIRVVETV